jgi:hypothetical protein
VWFGSQWMSGYISVQYLFITLAWSICMNHYKCDENDIPVYCLYARILCRDLGVVNIGKHKPSMKCNRCKHVIIMRVILLGNISKIKWCTKVAGWFSDKSPYWEFSLWEKIIGCFFSKFRIYNKINEVVPWSRGTPPQYSDFSQFFKNYSVFSIYAIFEMYPFSFVTIHVPALISSHDCFSDI